MSDRSGTHSRTAPSLGSTRCVDPPRHWQDLGDGRARGTPGNWQRLADPDGVLSPDVRAQRAAMLLRAHMIGLSLAAAEARRKRRPRSAHGSPVATPRPLSPRPSARGSMPSRRWPEPRGQEFLTLRLLARLGRDPRPIDRDRGNFFAVGAYAALCPRCRIFAAVTVDPDGRHWRSTCQCWPNRRLG